MNRAGGTYDPEEEARIAEWNSAYTRDDTSGKRNASAANAALRAENNSTPDSMSVTPGTGKVLTVVREGGGKKWEDPTLLEWNPLHPRLFIGNLAGEVTDDSLFKAFSKYPSISKARVVRDKQSTKSKSYGFVSFASTDDYFRAAKEMQGKYIGSHPILIKRANTEVKPTSKPENKHGKPGKHRYNNNSNNKKQGAGSIVTKSSGSFMNAGVQKKGKSNGPRMLG